MNWTTTATVLSTLGVVEIVKMIVVRVADWHKGRKKNERDGWKAYDEEASARRRRDEHIHKQNVLIIELGGEPLPNPEEEGNRDIGRTD